MARSPSKPASGPDTATTVRAVVAQASASAAEQGAPVAEPAGPTHVRLTGSGTYVAGKLLPIDRALEIGVEIPAALAEARLAAGTAEVVLGSAITAKALRDAVGAFAGDVRAQLDALTGSLESAADADLVDLVAEALLTRRGADTSRALAEAMEAAIDAHRAAIEAEAVAPSDGGEGQTEQA